MSEPSSKGPMSFIKSKRRYIIILGFVIVAAASFQWVTTQPWFCNACHEMGFDYRTWLDSTHTTQADCIDCHVEPGISGFVDEKVRGAEELIKHITGDYRIPIEATIPMKDSQCTACHIDPASIPDTTIVVRHDLHIGVVPCVECHSRVVHNAPGEPKVMQQAQCDSCHRRHESFPLTGGHAGLTCDDCHVAGNYTKIDTRCVSCHEAPPDHGDLIQDCRACHTTVSFAPSNFTHPQVDLHFPVGAQGFECSNCHPTTFSLYTCTGSGCHPTNDPEVGQAHSVFPLAAGHAGLNCNDCHVAGNFSKVEASCASCHDPPATHGELSKDCNACHTTTSFTPSNFTHPQVDQHYPGTEGFQCSTCHRTAYAQYSCTESGCHSSNDPSSWQTHAVFPLTNGHSGLRCDDCHTVGNFSDIDASCASCHDPPSTHERLSLDCAACHMTVGFTPSTFRHPQVAEHVPRGDERLDCSDCHRTTYGQYTCIGSGCHTSNNPGDDDDVEGSQANVAYSTDWSWISPILLCGVVILLSKAHDKRSKGKEFRVPPLVFLRTLTAPRRENQNSN